MTYWVWVFGEIEGLRWVLAERRMAFPSHAGSRAHRIRRGDHAILYVTRGAHHNPTRDRAQLGGLVRVTSRCREADPIEIAERDFTWTCRIRPERILPERAGPHVHQLVRQLDLVRREDVWGQYFRQSPIEISPDDFELLRSEIESSQSDR